MLTGKWSERSLSSWVAIGMALTVLPLMVAAGVDHFLLNRQVIAAFDDVAVRYRDQVGPLQRLEVTLWEAADSVDEFLATRDPLQREAYRARRVEIEAGFARLKQELAPEARLLGLVRRAQEDWSAADRTAARLLTRASPATDSRAAGLAGQFTSLIGSSSDKVRATSQGLAEDLAADHAAALLAFERSRWLSVIAVGLSILAIFAGVTIIVRIMLANIERLVDGARRFATGDRDHRIDVRIPPELRDLGNEFNRMIERIHGTEAELAKQARHDSLTGLANRRAYEEAVSEAFARIRRLGEQVVLLVLDIDHFKRINDSYGHAGGDEVLRAIGRTLRERIREVDKAFRIGGEEFAVLLVGTGLSGATVAAERLRRAIAARHAAFDGAEIMVTASIGLALAEASMSPDELLRAADFALYAAKSGGRDRVVVARGNGRGGGGGERAGDEPEAAHGGPQRDRDL